MLSLTMMNESDSVEDNALGGGCCPTTAVLNSYITPQDSSDCRNGVSTETEQPSLASYNVVLGVVETMIALAAVVGSVLVIASVYTNRKLRTITNLFVVSLAFADLMVGLLVLPFAIKVQVTETWNLGRGICDMYVTLDVLLCTASILNLCCISIDRYFAITRPLMCATKRSKRLAMSMIGAVWVLSVIITIPPLLGWKEKDRTNDGAGTCGCGLNQERSYVIFSALGSFYIPLAIMIFVYANIFVVARNAQRRWRNRGSNLPSSKPYSIPASPVAARGSTVSGVDEEEWSGGVGIGPRAVRVMSAGSDALCCGCFGKGKWTGTYALRVADSCSRSPEVIAGSYNRQTTTGSDTSRQTMLSSDAPRGDIKPCSVRHKSRRCSLQHDRKSYSTEHDAGQCSLRPEGQLSKLGSNRRTSTTASEIRHTSPQAEAKLSGAEKPNSTVSSTKSDVRTGLRTEDTGDCTRLAGPLDIRTNQVLDGQNQGGLPPGPQKTTTVLFSWKRRHSSLDCICYNGARTMIAESNAFAEMQSTEEEYHRLGLCNKDLIVRHADSLPTRLRRDRTVSIITTTTYTNSTSSRASSGSGGSGASVEGSYVSAAVKNLPIMNSAANIDRDLNSTCSGPRFDKRAATPRGDKVSCKTTLESEAATGDNISNVRAEWVNSRSLELPCRNVVTGESNTSFRSNGRAPRLQNPAADDSRSYGSIADVTMTPTMARRERRENSAAFRESKTVKTVSIVVGCFVLCWLPFFIVYITEPYYPNWFGTYLKTIVLWLGYLNSVINPFIYAYYNYEFRSTFWQLTVGRIWRRGRRLPRGIAPASPLSNIMRYPQSLRSNSVIVLDRFATNR